MINKKAQGMSTNTIILLIMGLVILVVLILGFSTGWKTFSNIATPTNVDRMAESCASVCGLEDRFSFCSAERNIRINEEDLKIKTSCSVLAVLPKFASYFEECSAIECDLDCENILIDDEKGDLTLTQGYNVSSVAKEVNCFVPN